MLLTPEQWEARLGPEVSRPECGSLLVAQVKELLDNTEGTLTSTELIRILYPRQGIVKKRMYDALWANLKQLMGYYTRGPAEENKFGRIIHRYDWHRAQPHADEDHVGVISDMLGPYWDENVDYTARQAIIEDIVNYFTN